MSHVPGPLRVTKAGTSSSPAKPAAGRPLAEIQSTSQRRNSPSWNQATKKMIVSRDTSPYTENTALKSPPPENWPSRSPNMSHSRFDENSVERPESPSVSSPLRKASIEKLQQASRVKNSNIFALESQVAYDPERTPIIERPTAKRPLSTQMANNNFTRFDNMQQKENSSPLRSPSKHKRTDSQIDIPASSYMSPTKSPFRGMNQPSGSPSPSPPKSSLAKVSQFSGSRQNSVFDAENGTWSEDDRAKTPRAQKSVTFHREPPVVQEYEQPTPEPSITAASDREGSWDSEDFYDDSILDDERQHGHREDDSFDADLENADKTPVVLPEDWTNMSPSGARRDLANRDDDVFDGPRGLHDSTPRRSTSAVSDGSETRPLPPLPGFMTAHKRTESGSSLGAATEKVSALQAKPLSPPKRAPLSKDDILQMTNASSMTLQDRLQLMGRSETGKENLKIQTKASEETLHPQELVITDLDTGERTPLNFEFDRNDDQDDSVIDDLPESQSPPRISRESILRKIRNDRYAFETDDTTEMDGDDGDRPSYAELAKVHPDQPIPSRETSNNHFLGQSGMQNQVEIKDEPEDDDIDLASIPAIGDFHIPPPRSPSRADNYPEYNAMREPARSQTVEYEETDSQYSESVAPEAESTALQAQHENPELNSGKESLDDAMQLLTVKDYTESTTTKLSPNASNSDSQGLPAFQTSNDYDFGLSGWPKPSPSPFNSQSKASPGAALQPSVDFTQRDYPQPDFNDEVSPPGSPGSVIHHSGDVSYLHDRDVSPLEPELPEIPEQAATIKTGGKLKTRPSATPADFDMMAEQRRMVSSEQPVPSIPAKFRDAPDYEGNSYYCSELDQTSEGGQNDGIIEHPPRQDSRRGHKKTMTIDLDIPQSPNDGDALGLSAEFDRVIEGQKKGYLTRQNTKIVVASNRFDADAKSKDMRPTSTAGDDLLSVPDRNSKISPRKASGEQFLKTEPWVGKRKSMRRSSAHRMEPAPPLPGHESALGVVNEAHASSYGDGIGDGFERGRLFVKVVGVKNLNLPMPRSERVNFQLTLDNGLHCVTTTSLELGQSAPIGQEFELVVLDDLEFQLTLSTKLTPPAKPTLAAPASPTKGSRLQKATGLSRFLTSPKKRAEKERLEREAIEVEERRLLDEAKKSRIINPSAWDLMHDLVNDVDGSFARSYINLKSHEKSCFGRKLTVDVPCYNEWALEKDLQVVNSVRSKRGTNTGPIRRPPYVIGQMEVQLLYVPKPKGATDEDMPRSMGNAVREMNKLGEVTVVEHDGHLSQQGGDCKHWRRRFFRLRGTKLTAYHEHTHQKRAVINLSKASRLVDDKTTLVADTTQAGGKNRRKSAFAEEDEGYAYVEEGFRIRFSNGETIDFYAESTMAKDAWMQALSQCIGKKESAKTKTTWTDLVLAREAADADDDAYAARRATQQDFKKPAPAQAPPLPTARGSTQAYDFTKPPPIPAPALPESRPISNPPTIPEKAPMRKANGGYSLAPRPTTPTMAERRNHRTRDAIQSEIF